MEECEKMPEYKRFIAYFYEYIDGKKQKSAGFAKVELRSGIWRVLFRLTAAGMPAAPVNVYGFVREGEQILAFPMGTIRPGRESAEEWAYKGGEKLWQERYSFSDLSGIWMQSPEGRSFLTVWDEEPVDLSRFLDQEKEKEKEKEKEERPDAGNLEAAAVGHGEGETEAENAPKDQPECARNPEGPKVCCWSGGKGGLRCRNRNWNLKEELFEKRESFSPFGEDVFWNCVRIFPCDIGRMQQEGWKTGKNSFLMHGFYHYRHLLLAVTQDKKMLLGVPGIENPQEKYMANMFGFDTFLACREKEPDGPVGYWLRELAD